MDKIFTEKILTMDRDTVNNKVFENWLINISENNSLINKTISEDASIENHLGKRYMENWKLAILNSVYISIFISGIIGNIFTCIVIVRNRYMHTATNYYLFSLAVSDILILLLGKLLSCYINPYPFI